MDTSEMIKEWFKSNKTKEFKVLNHPNQERLKYTIVKSNDVNQLCWGGDNHYPLLIHNELEWEEVIAKKPKWKEALFIECFHRWVLKDEIKCKLEDNIYYIRNDVFAFNGEIGNFDEESIDRDDIHNGIWYYKISED